MLALLLRGLIWTGAVPSLPNSNVFWSMRKMLPTWLIGVTVIRLLARPTITNCVCLFGFGVQLPKVQPVFFFVGQSRRSACHGLLVARTPSTCVASVEKNCGPVRSLVSESPAVSGRKRVDGVLHESEAGNGGMEFGRILARVVYEFEGMGRAHGCWNVATVWAEERLPVLMGMADLLTAPL